MLLTFSRAKRKSTLLTFFFAFCFFVCFLFLFSCSLSRFSFRSCQFTNWVKGLEQSSKDKLHADETGLLHELLDHSSAGSRGRARGARPPRYFCPNWGPKGRKLFWGQHPPPPPTPLSEGLDSPLHSITLTKWISYSYIYKFHQINEKFFLQLQSYTRWGWQKKLKPEVECSLLAESPFRHFAPSPIIDHKKESTFF